MADLALTGLASGRRHRVDRRPAHGDRAPRSTARSSSRQTSVTAHQTDLKDDHRPSSTRSRPRPPPCATSATWKPTQTVESSDATKVGVDACSAAPASAATRSRSPARLLRPARLRLHARARRRHAHAHGADPTRPATQGHDRRRRQRDRRRRRRRDQRATTARPVYAAVVKDGGDGALVLSARKTGASSDFTVDTSASRRRRAHRGRRLRARGARRSTRSYTLDGDAPAAARETNVVENAIPGLRAHAQGRHAEPGRSITVGAPRSTTTRSRRRSRPSSTPTTRSSPSTRGELDREERRRPPRRRADLPAGPAVRRHRA